MNIEKKWHVVYTKMHCQQKVCTLLIKNGIESYCPLTKVLKQTRDRNLIAQIPLFTSFIFVKINTNERSLICKKYGMLNFLYWLSMPAIIPDEEIDIIKLFLCNYGTVKIEKSSSKPDDLEHLTPHQFSLMDVQYQTQENKTIKIKLSTLGYWMSTEAEVSNIKIANKSNPLVRQYTKINPNI